MSERGAPGARSITFVLPIFFNLSWAVLLPVLSGSHPLVSRLAKSHRVRRMAAKSMRIALQRLVWIALGMLPRGGYSAEFLCDLSRNPTIGIRFNDTLGEYVRVDKQRSLRVQFDASLEIGQRRQQEVNPVLYARPCWCAEKMNLTMQYCLAEYDVCRVYDDGSMGCLNTTPAYQFASGFWPALLFYFGCLVLLFVGSEQGGAARGFLYRKLVSSCGRHREREEEALQRSVDRLILRNPNRATWLTRNHIRRERARRRQQQARAERQQRRNGQEHVEENEPVDTTEISQIHVEASDQPPNQLILRTRIYRKKETSFSAEKASITAVAIPSTSTRKNAVLNIMKHDSLESGTTEETEHGPQCAICLGKIKNGDRIGDLSCKHLFHVECLKPWLKRNNQCPLCQSSAATPRYDRSCAATEEDGHPSSESQRIHEANLNSRGRNEDQEE